MATHLLEFGVRAIGANEYGTWMTSELGMLNAA
jgi:hypothetical protein